MKPYLMMSEYIFQAMKRAKFEMLSDMTFAGKIPLCPGVFAFGDSEEACRNNLQACLESWLLLRLKLGHTLPIVHGINLNKESIYEQEFGMPSRVDD